MLPKVKVHIELRDVSGKPISTNMSFRLSTIEQDKTIEYNGLIVPTVYRGSTDERGILDIELFPNELGTQSSFYTIVFLNNNARVVIPNRDVNLSEILEQQPFPQTEYHRIVALEGRVTVLEQGGGTGWQEDRISGIETTLDPIPERISLVETRLTNTESDVLGLDSRMQALEEGGIDGMVSGYDKTLPLDELQLELDKLNSKLIFGNVNLTVLPGQIDTDIKLHNVFCAGKIRIIGSNDKMNSTHMIRSFDVKNTISNDIYIQGFVSTVSDIPAFNVDTTNGSVIFNRCTCSAGTGGSIGNDGVVVSDGIVHVEDCYITRKNRALYAKKGGEIIISDQDNNGTGNYQVFYADTAGKIFVSKHSIMGTFSTTTVNGGFISDGSIDGVSLPSPFAMIVLDLNATAVESYNLTQTKIAVGKMKYTFKNQPKRTSYGISISSPYNTSIARADKTQTGFIVEFTDKASGALVDPNSATITIWHNP